MSPISRAYARLERYIALLGINVGASKTTLEKRRELAARIPAAREPIQTISDLYTRERYGAVLPADDLSQTQNRRAERAWQRTRGNIIRRWLGRAAALPTAQLISAFSKRENCDSANASSGVPSQR